MLNRSCRPRCMRRLRERFIKAADALVDDLVARVSFDAIADVAEAYPLAVFPDAMGMPRENRALPAALRQHGVQLVRAAQRVLPRGHAGRRAGSGMAERADAARRLRAGSFGAEIRCGCRYRRADGRRGADRRALAAHRRRRHHGERDRGGALLPRALPGAICSALRANPGLARHAFEEAVRYETPVQTFFRTTTRPVEIGGLEVGEGEKVLMFLGAANRDPRKWERPEDYDIGRTDIGHVGFGSGIHVCVGMMLARLEGECVLSWRLPARSDRHRDHRPGQAAASTTRCAALRACRSRCGLPKAGRRCRHPGTRRPSRSCKWS